jgi:hypothetical protein
MRHSFPLLIGTRQEPSGHLLSDHLRWNLIARDDHKSNRSLTRREIVMNHRVRESSEIIVQNTGTTHKHRWSNHLQHRATTCQVGMLITYIAVMFNFAIFSRMSNNKTFPAPNNLLRPTSSLGSLNTLSHTRNGWLIVRMNRHNLKVRLRG